MYNGHMFDIGLTKRQKRKLISLAIALIAAGVSYFLNQPGVAPATINQTVAPGYYRVIRVDDGDTITVDMNGKEERVRYVGIDTPETQDPRKPVQCFGKVATDYNMQLLGTSPVRLESDPLSSNRDRYNRLLRYIYLPDGRLAQAEILKNGFAFAYVSFPFTKSDEFLNYQREAREQNRGLWNGCRPTPNEYGGFTSNPE